VVHINPINDPPSFTIQDIEFAEDFDGPQFYSISMDMPFGEEAQPYHLAFSSTKPEFIDVSITEANVLMFTPKENQYGEGAFTLTLSDGQDSVSQSLRVTVTSLNDAPSISIDTTLITLDRGDRTSLTFTVNDIDEDTMTVDVTASNPNILIAKAATALNEYRIDVSGSNAGTSSILISVSDGISELRSSVQISVRLITDTETNQTTFFSVYPNPASDFIVLNASENADVVLYRLSGQRILQAKISSSRQQLDIHELTPGIYILKVENGNQTGVVKLWKK
jgi:hypothetical protein